MRTPRSFGCGCADGTSDLLFRARPNLRVGAIDWPLFAVLGGIATAISFVVILVQNPTTRWVGLGWLVAGTIGYAIYRLRFVHAPVRATVKLPPAFGPALALEYRRLLVPIVTGQASDDAFDVAASLAAERGAQIVAVHVIEMPLDQPLNAELPDLVAQADRELDEARRIGESYGVSVIPRLMRARSAGAAIVEEARAARHARSSSSARAAKEVGRRRRAVFGETVDYVLKHAPCRVMVVASEAGRRMKLYRYAVIVLALRLRRDRHRAARGDGRGRRRRARLPPRRSLHRTRRRPLDVAEASGAVVARKLRASSESSTRPRSSRSRTARSRPRSTSRSESSRPTRSA